ncbi:MAG: hypothetical protein Kow0056_10280 [Coriobacteriia bacterium]
MVSVALTLAMAARALADQASAAELFFYPCDSCHPVTADTDGSVDKDLPIDFSGHEVKLDGHDSLGEGDAACLACHDDPSRNPGMLKVAGGGLVEITGDVSRVCYQCHSDKYKEWVAGIHGHLRSKCTDSGCHDPHTPRYMNVAPLYPFIGAGVQVKAVGAHEAFLAMPPPPVPPSADPPSGFKTTVALGLLVAAAIIGILLRGRSVS